jgi:hypothetical protein
MNEQRARLALLAKSKMAQQSGGLFSSMLPLMAMSGGTDNMLNMMLLYIIVLLAYSKERISFPFSYSPKLRDRFIL